MHHTHRTRHMKPPDQTEMKRKAILVAVLAILSFNLVVAKFICS